MWFELTLDRISAEDLARGRQPEVVMIPIKVSKRTIQRSPNTRPGSLAYFEAKRIHRNDYKGWNFVGLVDPAGTDWADCDRDDI